IDITIDYTMWIPKGQVMKPSAESYELRKPAKEFHLKIIGENALSFRNTKHNILVEIATAEKNAATLLRAADTGKGPVDLQWHAYITMNRVYPKTGRQIVLITSNQEWLEFLHACDASRDKICGLNLIMPNPALVNKRKRQEEILVIEAAKIDRKQNCRAARKPKQTPVERGSTAQVLVLDNDNNDTELNTDNQLESGESTGGDTDSDAVSIVVHDIYKIHAIQRDYDPITPVFVDPLDTNRFFFITAQMARIWAKEKIACDATGSKVVTTSIPPKESGIKWLSRLAEQAKRRRINSTGDSDLNLGSILKQLLESKGHPANDGGESSIEPALKAPLSRYLEFCEIVDSNGSIESCLTNAGLDQHILFDRNFLPREDLVNLGLVPGVITQLFMNVNSFNKKLKDELSSEHYIQEYWKDLCIAISPDLDIFKPSSYNLNKMVPIRKQPPRNSKLGIKLYSNQSKISFAARRRKYHQKAMSCGAIPWVHPKRYPKFHMNNDELPDFDEYIQRHSDRNRSKSTASERLRWKREDARKKKDLERWNEASLAVWRSQKQAEDHQHFFFLKTALADVQTLGPKWLFTPDDYKLTHQLLRSKSNAKQYYEQPEEKQKQWLEVKLFEARNGHVSHTIRSEWSKPY
ncbi:hypothetical protein DFH28DRAFT_899232, partial [Melampsora americana]